jgi:hypothetical protein
MFLVGGHRQSIPAGTRGFGEMVGLLWREGNVSGAIQLERLFKGHSLTIDGARGKTGYDVTRHGFQSFTERRRALGRSRKNTS